MVMDGSDSVLVHKETVRQYLAYTALRYRLVANAIGVNIFGSDPHMQSADTRIRVGTGKLLLKVVQVLLSCSPICITSFG